MGKKWKASRTFWFNVLAFGVALLLPALTNAGYTGDVPAEWAVFLPAAAAAINWLIRKYLTKEPII